LIYNDFAAEMSVRHSAANFFTFSEKYTTEEQMEQYIKIFSSNTFDGGRHQVRLQKIKN
jgi:ribose 5-phosphate isomerase RpiB